MMNQRGLMCGGLVVLLVATAARVAAAMRVALLSEGFSHSEVHD
jgi:hypothetical protein